MSGQEAGHELFSECHALPLLLDARVTLVAVRLRWRHRILSRPQAQRIVGRILVQHVMQRRGTCAGQAHDEYRALQLLLVYIRMLAEVALDLQAVDQARVDGHAGAQAAEVVQPRLRLQCHQQPLKRFSKVIGAKVVQAGLLLCC